MAVKIRLMRIGSKKRPFYRVVAVDERNKRTGKYLELLGTYNPLTEPHEIILKNDRIEYWTHHGAVLSDGYLRITKQAPQKPPRKPKKEKEAKPEPKAEVTPEAQESEESAAESASEPENQEVGTVEIETEETAKATTEAVTENPEQREEPAQPEQVEKEDKAE